MSGSETDSDRTIKSESSDENTFKSNLSGSLSFTSVELNMVVNIKATHFSSENPKLWFAQVEAQFLTHQVATERAKFDLVIPLLDTRVATEVEQSEEAWITQLLDKERLGDRTPSQHLRHLRTLVPSIDDAIIKAPIKDSTLDKLAESADRMVDRLSLKPQVAAATTNSSSQPPSTAKLPHCAEKLRNSRIK
ncbi:uncharacterized protein LOC103571394 [Microplitis demolitor]|uniref:uncharacterized protein LOC103571394 n=1 Tax=Microplitis demolitor TaxID=69319 RepID=UPI0004CD98C4|nr:uncharacterized protein LOC103571394 [Microplitis demolitor]